MKLWSELPPFRESALHFCNALLVHNNCIAVKHASKIEIIDMRKVYCSETEALDKVGSADGCHFDGQPSNLLDARSTPSA